MDFIDKPPIDGENMIPLTLKRFSGNLMYSAFCVVVFVNI